MNLSSIADVPNLARLLYRGVSGKEVGFSFNVAERCPVGCQCYWRERLERMEALGRDLAAEEMTDEAAVMFFQDMHDRGYLLATLVGGEPYVRPDLLAKLTPIIPANWLVTSGTTPLRRFPRTTHFVSIDGADAETHNTIRRSKRLFERIERNLDRIRSEGDFPAFAHTVLNAWNLHQIGGILEWGTTTNLVDGVMFSTMTPIRGSGDDLLRLSHEQREEVVRELVRQKEHYGDFLLNTNEMIERFHPDFTANQTPESCGTARHVASFDGSGERIGQCILGENADCTQCGCVITAMMETTFPRPHLGTIKMLATLRAS
jgi:molybdenum cofactor biosynthesis enzyme MoaA